MNSNNFPTFRFYNIFVLTTLPFEECDASRIILNGTKRNSLILAKNDLTMGLTFSASQDQAVLVPVAVDSAFISTLQAVKDIPGHVVALICAHPWTTFFVVIGSVVVGLYVSGFGGYLLVQSGAYGSCKFLYAKAVEQLSIFVPIARRFFVDLASFCLRQSKIAVQLMRSNPNTAISILTLTSGVVVVASYKAYHEYRERSQDAINSFAIEHMNAVVNNDPVLEEYKCPMTLQVCVEPVAIHTTQRKYYFEHQFISAWYKDCVRRGIQPVQPVTMQPLPFHNVNDIQIDQEAVAFITKRRQELLVEVA